MNLLFDEHLSPRLVKRLDREFPNSMHVHEAQFGSADDREVWEFARDHGMAIVTKDADFADLASCWGHPPKIVWIRLGNCSSDQIAELRTRHRDVIVQFAHDEALSTLQLG